MPIDHTTKKENIIRLRVALILIGFVVNATENGNGREGVNLLGIGGLMGKDNWWQTIYSDACIHFKVIRSTSCWILLVPLYLVAIVLYLPTLTLSWHLIVRLRDYVGGGFDFFNGKGLGWILEYRGPQIDTD